VFSSNSPRDSDPAMKVVEHLLCLVAFFTCLLSASRSRQANPIRFYARHDGANEPYHLISPNYAIALKSNLMKTSHPDQFTTFNEMMIIKEHTFQILMSLHDGSPNMTIYLKTVFDSYSDWMSVVYLFLF
jgi:hypothetical protein